jgi:lipid-A-disaccharide synthase-like uncharacterized protein
MGTFLGIHWSVWKIVGWVGNAVFSTRFIVQWYYTEKQKQVVVPQAFWWLSLFGSLILLAYSLFFLHDSVLIFAYAFTWIPYIRNLTLHRRHKKARQLCAKCGALAPSSANFCAKCGDRLQTDPEAARP